MHAVIYGAAVIVVGVTVYQASQPGPSAALMDVRLAATQSRPAQNESQHVRAAQPDTAAAPTHIEAAVDPEESTVAQYAAEKYQFLLDDLHYLEASQVEQLHRALLARERLAGTHEEALAKTEDQIRGLLNPADYATYEMLRESDLELFKLKDYAAGIGNVAPLSDADREAILRTKLAYKQRFRQLLADSGLQRKDSSAAEREYAYAVTARALDDYQQNYLQEVRQYLPDPEQYALLSNYEGTEFKAELARLQSMISLPAQGGS